MKKESLEGVTPLILCLFFNPKVSFGNASNPNSDEDPEIGIRDIQECLKMVYKSPEKDEHSEPSS